MSSWCPHSISAIFRLSAYCILSLPLALGYLFVDCLLLAIGVATLCIWIGFPILLLLFKLNRKIARGEVRLANYYLDFKSKSPPNTPFHSRRIPKHEIRIFDCSHVLALLSAHLRTLNTYSILLFIILRLPVSIILFLLGLLTLFVCPLIFLSFPLVKIITAALLFLLTYGERGERNLLVSRRNKVATPLSTYSPDGKNSPFGSNAGGYTSPSSYISPPSSSLVSYQTLSVNSPPTVGNSTAPTFYDSTSRTDQQSNHVDDVSFFQNSAVSTSSQPIK